MGLFQVSSPVCMPRRLELELLGGSRVIHVRVVDCHKCLSGSYNLQTKLSFDACRRAEPRIPTDLPAQVQVLGASSAISAKVTDVSHAGLGLQMHTAVPVGTTVGVDMGYAAVLGEVRHCAHQVEKYRLGVHVHQFIANHGALSPAFAACDAGFVSSVAWQAFVLAVGQRQRRYEAILLSLAFRKSA